MSAERTDFMVPPRIVRKGKRASSYLVKTYKDASSAAETIKKGMFLQKRNDGTVTPSVRYDTPTALVKTSKVRYVALEDWTATEAARHIMVQEVDADTVFEAQVTHASESDAVQTQANIGAKYEMLTAANGGASVKLDEDTNPIAEIVDVEANYSPFGDRKSEPYHFVYFRLVDDAVSREA